MKKLLLTLSLAASAFVAPVVTSAEVNSELIGKWMTVGEAVTELTPGNWYLLNNVGRRNYVKEETSACKMRALPTSKYASENAGYLFKVTNSATEGKYNIQSGNGFYFELGDDCSSVSQTARDFDIHKIGNATNVFYMKDVVSEYIADGQETGNNFVGWGKAVPTNTTGNSAYKFISVTFVDFVTVTYTFTDVNGQTLTRNVDVLPGENAAEHIPALDFFTPSGLTVTGDAAVVNENQKSFAVNGSWNFPMEFGKVYRVHLKPSDPETKNIKYDGTNVKSKYTDSDGERLAAEYLWYFKYNGVINGVPTVTMHGLATDDSNGISIGTVDNSQATITANPTAFIVKPTTWGDRINGDFCLKHSTANNWINYRDPYFSTWNSSSSLGDSGSVLRLSSLTENDYELFGYCNSAESVEAAKASPTQQNIRPLLANFDADNVDDYNIIANANAFAALGIASADGLNNWNTFKASLPHNVRFTDEQSTSIIEAYRALVSSSANTAGAHIKISCNVAPADYMCVCLDDNSFKVRRYGNDVNGNKTTWTLRPATGGFYLYNEYSGKYANFPADDESEVIPVASENEAAIFVFDIYDLATARYGLKNVGNTNAKCYLQASEADADGDGRIDHNITRAEAVDNASWYLHASDETTANNEANIGADDNLNDARANFLKTPGDGLGEYTITADPEGAYASAYEQYKALADEPTNAEKHAVADALRAACLGMTYTYNMPKAGTYLTFRGANNENVALFYTTGTYNHNGNHKTILDKTNADYSDAAAIMYYDGEHLLSYTTGYYLGLSSGGWPTFIGEDDMATNGRGNTPVTLGIAPGSHASLYQINYARNNGAANCGLHINTATENGVTYLFGDRCGNDANTGLEYTRNEDAHNWVISQVNELPVAIHADGYGSFIAPVAVRFSAGNHAYVGSVNGSVLTFAEVEAGTDIAPNTPVIIKGTASSTVNATINYGYVAPATPTALATEESTIRLGGSHIAKKQVAETDLSTFAKAGVDATPTDDNNVTLNKVDDGSVIPVNTLLLTLHNDSKLIAEGGETATVNLTKENVTTGISAIEFRNLDGTREIYDLQGRRVQRAGKGLYIINGVKTLVK